MWVTLGSLFVSRKPLTAGLDSSLCCLAAMQTTNPFLPPPVLGASRPHPNFDLGNSQHCSVLNLYIFFVSTLPSDSLSSHCILPVLSVQRSTTWPLCTDTLTAPWGRFSWLSPTCSSAGHKDQLAQPQFCPRSFAERSLAWHHDHLAALSAAFLLLP